jgi:hypothetical protein
VSEPKMVKIEVLEKFSIDNSAYYAGEVRVVPEEVALTACGAGWAKDPSGEIPTGERDPSAKKLDIQPMAHRHDAQNPGA